MARAARAGLARAWRQGAVLFAGACDAPQHVVSSFPVTGTLTDERRTRVCVDVAPDLPVAGQLESVLGVALGRPGGAADLYIEASTAGCVLPALGPNGWGLTSAVLVGDVATARRALGGVDSASRMEAAGVSLRPARRADIAAIVALNEREAIAAAPPGTSPRPASAAARLSAILETAVDSPWGAWVFEREGRIEGWFRASSPSSPEWPGCAGFTVAFAPVIRGCGLLSVAYAVALERLAREGVPRFRGATSQPAVLAVGARLGRTLVGFHARPGATLDLEHFGAESVGPRGRIRFPVAADCGRSGAYFKSG